MSTPNDSRIHSGSQRCKSRSETGAPTPTSQSGPPTNLGAEVSEELRKKFLHELSQVPELWSGNEKRRKQMPEKWFRVSRQAGFKDVSDARQLYYKIKTAIEYRIKKGEAEGKLSKELLEAGGSSILPEFYAACRYELWPEVEFLTKAILLRKYGVNLSEPQKNGMGRANANNPRGMNGGRPGVPVPVPITTPGPGPPPGIFPGIADLYFQRQMMGQPQSMGMGNCYQPHQAQPGGGDLNRPSCRINAATATVTSQQQQFGQPQQFQQQAQTPANAQHYMNGAQGGFMDSTQQQEEPYEAHRPGFDRMEYHSITQLKEEQVDEDLVPPQSLRNPLELYYQGSPATGITPEQSYGVSQMEVNRRIQHFSDFLNFIKILDKEKLKKYSQQFMQLSAVASQLVVDEGLGVIEVRRKLEKMQLRLSENS